MKQLSLLALVLLASASGVHAAQLESQLPTGLDSALRCAYFADKAEQPSEAFKRVALRITKSAYPALSGDALTLLYADNYALTFTLAHGQLNDFADRQQGTVKEQLKKAAVELMQVNQCEEVK